MSKGDPSGSGSNPNISKDLPEDLKTKGLHGGVGKYTVNEDIYSSSMNTGSVKSNFGCCGGLISLLAWILDDFR